jgi:2-furoyl-CoA dehydrogenase large subunit
MVDAMRSPSSGRKLAALGRGDGAKAMLAASVSPGVAKRTAHAGPGAAQTGQIAQPSARDRGINHPVSAPVRSVRRKEDARLLRGRGSFVADRVETGTAAAAIVRSTHAHARVRSINAERARSHDGVHAVLTSADLLGFLDPLPSVVEDAPPYLPIAAATVRFVGEPVAIVVAKNRYLAEDAASLVEIDYEALPAVVDPLEALEPGAPLLHDASPGNIAWHRRYTYGDVEGDFAVADKVVSREFRFPSFSSIPLETYGVVAEYDKEHQEYVAHCNFQGPFSLHAVLARGLRVRADQVRIVAPRDSGGSFGSKAMLYPYVALLCAVARSSGRRVSWIEDRREHLIASSRGSDRVSRFEAAVRSDGTVLSLHASVQDNVGAYLRAPEPASVVRLLSDFQGAYKLRSLDVDATCVLTNTAPTGLNRGYGGPQHYFCLERLIDEIAAEVGLDPVAVRLKNFVAASEMPFTTVSGGRYDSGDYEAVLRRALELAHYDDLRRRQEELRTDGKLFGIGIAAVIQGSTSNMGYVSVAETSAARAAPGHLAKSGNQETARIKMDTTGRVSVAIATLSQGQGHETVAARIVSDVLCMPYGEVRVDNRFDSASSVWSVSSGSYSSRFAAMGATSVLLVARRLKAKLARVASYLLEASEDDLDLTAEGFVVRGSPGRNVSLRRIAGAAHWNPGSLPSNVDTGFEASATFRFPELEPPDPADRVNASGQYGFIVDVAAVQIDSDTGGIAICDYVSVHDAGTILDPAIVEGQRRGGFAHGLGGALFEHVTYSTEGVPTAQTLYEYTCPTAADMPALTLGEVETPSPLTPLGAKGCGDGSVAPTPVAIANAAADALRPLGIAVDALPLEPEAVWAAIARAR